MYYLKFLMPETMKLHGNNKSKITKDKNGENGSPLEITEVVFPGGKYLSPGSPEDVPLQRPQKVPQKIVTWRYQIGTFLVYPNLTFQGRPESTSQ